MQNDVATSSLVIACFDGHGQFGHDVSKFCKVFMETTLVSHPLFLKDLYMAILDVTAQLGTYKNVYFRLLSPYAALSALETFFLSFLGLMCHDRHTLH